MNAQSNTQFRGNCLQPPAIMRPSDSLDFIDADHLRERQICTIIDDIAGDGHPSPKLLAEALNFLKTEFPLHLKDEEEDLFPLLRRRCEPEDEMSKVISRLLSDHSHAKNDIPRIIAILENVMRNLCDLTSEEQRILQDFVGHSRRHLIVENAIILPFARLRLTERDLETLYLRMCQRRGLDSLAEARNAE